MFHTPPHKVAPAASAVVVRDRKGNILTGDAITSTALILNRGQFEAAYSAMCALNNVNGKVKASFGDVSTEGINVFEEVRGTVRVVEVRKYDVVSSEDYDSQADFTDAYGI